MQKHERLEQDVKVALSNIIMYDVKNTSVTGSFISVTDVEITPDQKWAKVYISIYGKQNKQKIIDGLKSSKGYVRSELAKRVRMRNIPDINFVLDDSMEYGIHMDKVIKDVISNDLKNKKEQ